MYALAYLGTGALVGFAAGLLGIGGGVVMVPLLVLVFNAQGFPSQHVLHMAIGIVVITSMLAAPLGAALAHRLPVRRLRTLFAALLYLFAIRMLVGVW